MTAQDDRRRYLHSVIWDALRRRDDIPLDELPEHVQAYLAETGERVRSTMRWST